MKLPGPQQGKKKPPSGGGQNEGSNWSTVGLDAPHHDDAGQASRFGLHVTGCLFDFALVHAAIVLRHRNSRQPVNSDRGRRRQARRAGGLCGTQTAPEQAERCIAMPLSVLTGQGSGGSWPARRMPLEKCAQQQFCYLIDSWLRMLYKG